LDIKFGVLVRVDNVVRNPELIKKMCANGILNYEMGIESPNIEDLRNIRKDVTLEMHEKAVKIIKDNGAWAGGTFVIGLPNQTEEEIMKFPQYAKKIGLSGAAFGIATPFPRTELYKELEQNGLITEHNWNKYDNLHSVFDLTNLSKKRLEELAIYCHAKFWTLDTLIEQTRATLKPGEKISLEEFIKGILTTLSFAWNTTSDIQAENVLTYMRVAAEAGADPCVEEYTRKVGIHNVLEFSRFLFKILGSQRIQFTITSEGVPITSYIIQTTGSTVEYVKAISGRLEDATINLDVDLGDLDFSDTNSPMTLLKNWIRATVSLREVEEMWSRLRLLAALGYESTRQIMYRKIEELENVGNYAINGGPR